MKAFKARATPCPTGAKALNGDGRNRHEAFPAGGRRPGSGLVLQRARTRAHAAAQHADRPAGHRLARHTQEPEKDQCGVKEAQAFVGKNRTELPAPVDPSRWRWPAPPAR